MILFFVGIIEMIILALWTRCVSGGRRWVGSVMTVFNIIIWYFVLRALVEDINNFKIVALYALGCAIGTFIGTGSKK